MNTLRAKWISALIVSGMIWGGTSVQAGTTIAHWQFEGSASTLGDDSSANSYHLYDATGTVVYSSTEYAPGVGSTGSVYFDGTGMLTSFSFVDLTPYEGQNLRLSFWMKNQTPQDANEYGGLGTIFETGSRFKNYTGGIYAGVNGTYSDCSDCGMVGMMMNVDVNADQLPHAVYTGGSGVWEHYALEFRPNSADAAEVTKIYKDGVLMPDTVVNGDHEVYGGPNSFLNTTFYLGMRESMPEYSFTGKLDDVQIYDAATDTLVAEWLFEDGAFLSDTSGNGNDLVLSDTYTGITTSTDVMSGHTGTSAAFDGNGLLSTLSTLDLSDYDQLRVKYRVKNESTNIVGICMEHSSNAYAANGGFVLSTEEWEGSGCAGIQLAPGANTDRNIEAIHVPDNEWVEYDITFDQTADNYEDVVVVTKNGVLQANDTPNENRRGVPTTGDEILPFPNEVVNVGGRDGNLLNFIGYLDEMKLEVFTDGGELLAGDLNGDGFVGGDDLDIVRSFWGQGVPNGDLLSGDPSGDGFVGGDDLDIVRANWGQGTPPAPTAVPEPNTMVLLAIGALAVFVLRRRP